METQGRAGRVVAALALAVAVAALAWGGPGSTRAGAGVETTKTAENEPAWPVCRTASPAGGAEGADVEQTSTVRGAATVPPIDAEAPARIELATFALG